jgi:molybdenum cofactor guanylyltransferase
MRHTSTLAAAILAGGRATRLGGVNKATLALGVTSIIDRQLDALRETVAHVFIVGTDSEAWSARHLTVVPDDLPGHGALGGIYTAIVHSPTDRTLVLACDMPFVSAAFLRRLADEDADVVIPRSHRGCEPLCAVYSRVCAPEIRGRIDRGELQASTLPKGVHVVEIGPDIIARYDPDDLLFMNVNTPHDYERARGRSTTADPITTDRTNS